MILLCDENINPRVADILTANGFDARSFRSMGWLGRSDADWLPLAGQIMDSLILTCDRMILDDPDEYAAIFSSNVGAIFLTTGQMLAEAMVEMLISVWPDLEVLNNTVSRPFIRFLTSNGLLLTEFNR